jgi:hypothetical protein
MAIPNAAVNKSEAAMLAARAARNKQDTKYTHLINVIDASLLPNVPKLRNHRDLRVYTGDIHATEAERKRWLETGGARLPRAVVLAEEEPFDIGTAELPALREFAFNEYGFNIPDAATVEQARKQVNALAKKAGALTA